MHMARRVGARISHEPYMPIQRYKSLFLQSTSRIQRMKDSSAFEVTTLAGHRGRVMAVTHNRNMLATGQASPPCCGSLGSHQGLFKISASYLFCLIIIIVSLKLFEKLVACVIV